MQPLPTLRRRDARLFSPWRDFDVFDDWTQRLSPAGETFLWAPRVDFAEENGKYVLTAELPGIDPKDVDIEVEENTLSIKGEKKTEREESDERVQISERRYGSFERRFVLPSTADPEKITADFQKGVLKLEIPKRAEARGRKIKVQSK